MQIDAMFEQAVAAVQESDSGVITIPKAWSQGRTVYGGMSASLLYVAMQSKLRSPKHMRSLNVNFIGPLLVEKPSTLEVEVLREGKNVTQVMAKLTQDGKTAVMAQAVFALDRESKILVDNKEPHNLPAPTKGKFIPPIPGIVPKFIAHLDLDLVEGGMPFSGSKTSDTKGWIRFKKAPEKIEDGHLIALIDGFPCTVLQTLRWPAPASTMNWNIEFLHPHAPIKPTDWLAYTSTPRQAADGYCHMESDIWDASGRLIAISRQVVAVFDK
ncbi:thioesterase family protein [Thalassotalea agarivorans]|uniref:Acyl-CoA thioesterase n=1 Tax=Thalassotalea agarivorans TaxID=349064 RepID=A0A1I0AJG3_THASX|nr:thioesterase family protein [Thalassotalea agarivorans]SES94396.1 Acyl-CoA thioesterase [Thalassotalea agarivorans]